MAATAELEHFCGYGGAHLNTVRYHPLQAETLIYTAASAVIIEDVNDPHKQEFLRGQHDNEVSALDVSANGKLVASGQLGSPSRKGAVAPVAVWDFDARQVHMVFEGLAHRVLSLRFSPDGRFLAATGANQMIYVWDVSTGEVVASRKTEAPCFLSVWGAMESGGRYPSYTLCTAYDSQILVHQLAFDIRTMCYGLTSEVVQMPPTGLQRKHICGMVRGDFLLTGTLAGDMCVFSLKTKVFRTSLPLCSSGLTSMAAAGSFLYVAGGDGRVKTLTGDDTHWDCQAENVLEIGVTALTPSSDSQELVAATRNGKLFRLLCSDLTYTLQAVSHTAEVTDVAFGPSSDTVVTCSEAGEVFLVDLSDYMPVTAAASKSPARCVVVAPGGEILAGYADGYLRAWSPARSTGSAEMLWQANCHREGVSALRASPDFIVTGGGDCCVRFWHAESHSMLTSFTNHRKPVADITVDEGATHLVHSTSLDKQVVTYDLKQNKPAVQHFTQGSSFTGLSQRKDRDKEVVTSSLDGRILFWDVDYADPTGCIDPPAGQVHRLTCVSVSPSGRYIAAGSEDACLRIYDLATCSCIQECEGHMGSVNKVRWSPDQKQIVTAGKDGCVVVWNFFEL